jgi:hypothetical protein
MFGRAPCPVELERMDKKCHEKKGESRNRKKKKKKIPIARKRKKMVTKFYASIGELVWNVSLVPQKSLIDKKKKKKNVPEKAAAPGVPALHRLVHCD